MMREGSTMQIGAFIAFLLAALPAQAGDKLTSNDVETRLALTFTVAEASLQKLLPSGWILNPPISGAAKGYNLGFTLINQTMTQDPEGKPLPARTYVVLVAPVKKSGTEVAGVMVFGGFMGDNGAPGAYGVYVPAKVSLDRRQQTDVDGRTIIDEHWEASAEDGSSFEAHVEFSRGNLIRSKLEPIIYSSAKPGYYRVYKLEQVVDVVYSGPSNIGRATKISVKASGPILTSLFDGTEKLVSINSTPHYTRSIFVPEP
jgi:hypothetical protein